MNVEEAIRTRRSIGKVKPDPVPRELVERMLEAAVWAPNHHHTEPWKFIVMTGEGCRTLGGAYAAIAREAASGKALSDAELAELDHREHAKALRAPVVIAAVCSPSGNPRAVPAEELAAVHAAVHNMLLTAHALGLGAVWRTGDPAYHPAMRAAFGLPDTDSVVGFVYVGYPDMVAPPAKRIPAADKTTWLEG